jgi:putative membrane protein
MHDLEPIETITRRSLLTKLAVAGLGVATVGIGASAQASLLTTVTAVGLPDVSAMMPASPITAAEFAKIIYPTVHLSKIISHLAMGKAENPDAKQFALFEYTETDTVSKIFSQMEVPLTPMAPMAAHILNKMKTTDRGSEFDKTYLKVQHDAHVWLRDTASNFLSNSAGTTNSGEMHGRHLAMLSLAVFKEHVALTAKYLSEM